jgi:hypothetical protein
VTVFAFDVDGTLASSAGPITDALLIGLQHRGDYVYIVSPSSARPPFFPIVLPNGGGDRVANLQAVKAMHPDEDRFIYVSDNGDIAAAEEAEFEYVGHIQFASEEGGSTT